MNLPEANSQPVLPQSAQQDQDQEIEDFYSKQETEAEATQAEALRRLRARRLSVMPQAQTQGLSVSPSNMQQPMASTLDGNQNMPE